ncbi:alpha/beta fold hydrolase [Kibdelosporangium aridum]|uniref:Alpha/beta hydrolase fold n=1 Tax=Kibdelosporangium aridum TaxID=2030 RepID=A0A1Y5XLL4_KIBAR|nr:alpha/beta fold hydrolase [Kibdelosporangium aridum]SMD05081.1 alpha/beta hydrolase fold [Kibdelosporangium aridum]
MRIRRGSAIAASVTVFFGLTVIPAAAEDPKLAAFTKQQVSWAPCDSGPPPPGFPPEEWEKLWAGLECATLTVPMDYRNPDDGRLSIAVSRRKAKNPAKRQGVLLLNPGGPGGDGLLMPSYLTGEAIADSFDLIGFDPRGVGRSTELRCEAGHWEPARTRPTDDQFPVIAAAKLSQEQACQRAGGGLRPFISTANTARDMDVIRAALGEKKINYLGFSYGTYLGAVYGSLFPRNLNRSVLDSSMHPDWLYYEQSKQQAVAARQNFDAWAAWVAERDKTYHLGTSVAQVTATLDALGKQLAVTPVPWPEHPEYGKIDRNLFDMILGYETVSRPGWALTTELILKIKAAVGGTLSPDAAKALAALTKYSIPETFNGVFPTVTCEADWPADLNVYYEQMRIFRERYPYGRGAGAAEPTECTFRSFTPPERITDLKRNGYPTGLVVQAEFDPSTQYDGGPAMAAKLNNSLISIADEGAHGLYGRNDCATKKINEYLIGGVLPGSRVTCPGAPRPNVPVDGLATQSSRSLEERALELIKTQKLDRGF